MNSALSYIFLGLAAGVLSGILGIGGGAIVIPALVLMCGFSQHAAQGTTLAMLVPPIGLLAAWSYYSQGQVNMKVAALLCAGFFFGGLLGAKAAFFIPESALRKVFSIFLIVVAVRLFFSK